MLPAPLSSLHTAYCTLDVYFLVAWGYYLCMNFHQVVKKPQTFYERGLWTWLNTAKTSQCVYQLTAFLIHLCSLYSPFSPLLSSVICPMLFFENSHTSDSDLFFFRAKPVQWATFVAVFVTVITSQLKFFWVYIIWMLEHKHLQPMHEPPFQH